MHCPGGNDTEPIWRVLAPSDGISSWTPLKPQHSNPKPNPYPLANQPRCIDFLTPPTSLIILHRLPTFLESLMPLKNWSWIHARWSNNSLTHSIYFLSWNLLDVAHSYLTCCGGCICCFRFFRFGHSYLCQWPVRCVSERYALESIAHCRRRLVLFLH